MEGRRPTGYRPCRGERPGTRPDRDGRRDRGTVTAELALAFPAVVLALLLAVGVGQVVIAEVRCTDAARVGARESARGETDAVVVRQALRAGPPGAQVGVASGGGSVAVEVTAVVRLPLPGSPGVTVHGHAVGPVEQP
jgi:hypothetical protein